MSIFIVIAAFFALLTVAAMTVDRVAKRRLKK